MIVYNFNVYITTLSVRDYGTVAIHQVLDQLRVLNIVVLSYSSL